MNNWLCHFSSKQERMQKENKQSKKGSETPACDHVWFWVMLAKQPLKDKGN